MLVLALSNILQKEKLISNDKKIRVRRSNNKFHRTLPILTLFPCRSENSFFIIFFFLIIFHPYLPPLLTIFNKRKVDGENL